MSIHDKHIELIVRQMLRRVLVAEPGDAPFLPGERVDTQIYAEVNREPGPGGQAPGRGPARAHGDHQGVAGHRLVAVGRLLPGDDPGPHRGGHRGQVRPALRPEGEHHHRQADPGRDGHGAATATSRSTCPTRPGCRCGPTASTRRPRTSPPGCVTWAARRVRRRRLRRGRARPTRLRRVRRARRQLAGWGALDAGDGRRLRGVAQRGRAPTTGPTATASSRPGA